MSTPVDPVERSEPAESPAPERRRRGAGLRGGVPMGRPFGIPLFVAPTWFVVAAILTVSFAPSIQRLLPGTSTVVAYVGALAFAVLLYASVLLHELSHSLVAKAFGLPVRRITLHLLGGVSEIGREAEGPGRDFLVAFAGPAVSLVLGGVGVLVSQLFDVDSLVGLLVVELAFANLLVGGFNLLPGLPLDGGHIVSAAVWRLTGRRLTGTVAAGWSGRAIAVVVLLAPFLVLPWLGVPVSFLQVVWAVLIAAFVWTGAGAALESAKFRARIPGLQLRQLARRTVAVPSDLPLAEGLRRLTEQRAGGMVLLDGDGSPYAVASESATAAIPEQRRPWVPVSAVGRSLVDGMVLPVHLEGDALLDAMQRAPATEYLVVDDDGAVFGVLSAADVERVFARR